MADYAKTTDFEAKDSLPSGNPNKVIKGSEFETEFDAISTAIATKADKASPTFTGTVTVPTLAVSSSLSLGGVAVTSTAAELNKLDGCTATTAELNYVDGVTSSIQDQLDDKAPKASPTFTGNVTAPTLTIGSWEITDDGGKLTFDNGSTRFSIDASGNVTADGDVTANGTP
jgi:hypothetical protein